MSWVRIPSVTLLPSLTTSSCEGFFCSPTFLPLSFFSRRLSTLLRHNAPPATKCRCVSLRSCRVLGFLPLLLSPSCPGCSVVVLFFGAVYECAHERRARVGDIGVNLSARSHREIREPTKTCILSRDLSALRAAAVLRFPPVNEFAPRARIYTRASVAFRFLPSLLHRVAHWVGC